MWFAVILFVALSLLSAGLTVGATKRLTARELNPTMRLFLRSPTVFWVAQGILVLIVSYCIVRLGLWFVSLAISARSMVAYNDWLVYRGKTK